MNKYLSALLALLFAFVLQLWFVPGGMRGDFILATLIAFSFLFDLAELSVALLLALFIVNPFPWPSIDMALFILLPLATYFARRWFSLDMWIGGAAAIALGIFLFYIILVPGPLIHWFGFFVLDVLVCVAFGELLLYGMEGR